MKLIFDYRSKMIEICLITHSQMEHYFFSYLLTYEVDLFKNSAIVAIKSDIVNFIQVKSIKVTSGFNLRRKKKSARLRCHAEKSKTNLKTLIESIWIRPQGSQGCQKIRFFFSHKKLFSFCAKIAPKRQKLQKSSKFQNFYQIYLSSK